MYYNSLVNDPDMMIQVELVDVLYLNDTMTPWKSNLDQNSESKLNVSSDITLEQFSQVMENISQKDNYTYDYAVAVMKYFKKVLILI